MPLENAKNICFVFDIGEDKIFEAVKYLTSLLQDKKIKYSGLAVNLTKHNFPDLVLDHNIQLLTKKEVSYIGTPDPDVIETVTGDKTDLFIDLSAAYSYTHDFIARSSRATFKVGRFNYINNPFDLVIGNNGETTSPLDYIKQVFFYLTSIKSAQ